jgi:hypothetical protein
MLNRSQVIESICRNGHTEALKIIFQTFPEITPMCIGDYIGSCAYIELAKMIRFIAKDGVITKIR